MLLGVLIFKPRFMPTDLAYVLLSIYGSIVFVVLLNLRDKLRLARQDALHGAGYDRSCLAAAASLLRWEELAGNIDRESRLMLGGLLGQGSDYGGRLQPRLQKAASRLKKLGRANPDDPGLAAYRGYCLALLGHIADLEAAACGKRGKFFQSRLWRQAEAHYLKALALAPEEASIPADWGRWLENRALVFRAKGLNPSPWFEEGLKYFELAAQADSGFKAAWRGQGRILAHQAMELEGEAALKLLEEAVGKYELARNDGGWAWDFYDEFAQVVFAVPQYHPDRRVHYFCYAARLWVMTSELNGGLGESLMQAGRAFTLAASAAQEGDPGQALKLYRESLALVRSAIRRDGADDIKLIWAARNLISLYALAEEPGFKPGGEDGPTRLEIAGWLDEAAELCARAAALNPSEVVLSEWADVLSRKADKGGAGAAGLWAAAARKYAQAIASFTSPDEKLAMNWHNWGYALYSLAAGQKSPQSRLKLLGQAAAKYGKAAALNGDGLVTLGNWGDVLGDMAELADKPEEAARLRGEAAAKFEKASVLYPGQAEPWRLWSGILQNQARSELKPAQRRELWQAALGKLECGVKADPGSAATWVAWGQTLSELYSEGAEYEKPLLMAGIIEKYEKALELSRDNAEIWAFLGRARLEASEFPQEASICGGVVENAAAAVESFSTACSLAAEQGVRWADWGRALFRQAQLIEGDASFLAALREAAEKYQTAVALEPENFGHHTALAHIFYQWGWRLEDQEAKSRKFKGAYAHCAEAGRLAPYDPTVWRNWGRVTEAMASIEKDPAKSFDWQSEAEEKFYQADLIGSTLLRNRRH